MKTRRNKLIKVLAGATLGALSLATVASLPMAKNTASAEDYALEMIGAAIRPDENYGIRFTARTGAIRYESKYYVMIVPESWRTDEAHALDSAVDGDYYAHLKGLGFSDEDDPETESYDPDFITMECIPTLQEEGQEDAGKYYVKGTISAVHFSNTNVKFFGIAYEVDKDGNYTYATSQEKGVRSIAWVAGAALNDDTTDYSDEIEGKLNQTIYDAYDSLKKNDQGTTEAFPYAFDFVGAGSKLTALDKGSVTPFEMNDMPDAELNIPVEWSLSKRGSQEYTSTITENGVLTVNDESGEFNVNAQIAGITKTLSIKAMPAMAEGMLQDFAANTDTNASGTMRHHDINQYLISGTTNNGKWVESKIDKYGSVGYGVGWAYNQWSGSNKMGALRLLASKAELEAMNIDAITIRFLIEPYQATDATNDTVGFFGYGVTAFDYYTWNYLTITKDMICGLSKLPGATADEKWDSWLDLFCNTGAGLGAVNGFWSSSRQNAFYIDYIAVGSTRLAEHQLENFDDVTKDNMMKEGLTQVAKGESQQNVSAQMSMNSPWANCTYLTTKADGAETPTTEYGVVQIKSTNNNYYLASMRFEKTQEQLAEILQTLDTMTFRVMIAPVSGETQRTVKFLGNERTLDVNTWTDVTLTKAELIANFTEGENDEAKYAIFAENFCETGKASNGLMGTKSYMFAFTKLTGEETPEIYFYIDEVTFTTVSAS